MAALTLGCSGLLLALMLAACGGDGGGPTAPPPVATPAPTPPPEPPAAPTVLRVSAFGTDFTEWSRNAVSGANGYQVQFRTDSLVPYGLSGEMRLGLVGLVALHIECGGGVDESPIPSPTTPAPAPPPEPPPPLPDKPDKWTTDEHSGWCFPPRVARIG